MLAKILVVGGGGFIGRNLVNVLSERGFRGTIFDKNPQKDSPFDSAQGDVRDLKRLAEVAQGHDVIYNLAAEHRDDVRPESLYFDVNVKGAENVCLAAERTGIRSIIFTSSVAVYGESWRKLGEEDPHQARNLYGQTKSLAEKVYFNWARDAPNRNLIIVRPTVVFGPGNRGNVYNLIAQVRSGTFFMVGSGDNRKSIAYVENVVDFLVHVLNISNGIHVFNYSDGPDFAMKELISFVRQSFGRSPEARRIPLWVAIGLTSCADAVASTFGLRLPISRQRLDKFRANTEVDAGRALASGFKPRLDLKEALSRTIASEFKTQQYDVPGPSR